MVKKKRTKFVETEGDEVYVVHDRDVEVTAAAYIKNGLAYLAKAECSPMDQWCRKTGRRIAVGRAKKAVTIDKTIYGPVVAVPKDLGPEQKPRIKWAVLQLKFFLDGQIPWREDTIVDRGRA